MNKWYFYKNNVITEAMDLEDAKEFVVTNPDSYGWQHSYTQWLPLHCISDFADIIPPLKPLLEVPQDVVDEFNNKTQNIVSYLEEVNADIANGEKLSQKFAQEIKVYKEITQKLSPEVQANINSIEQQYCLLQQKLKEIRQSTHLTANEINKVVTDFNLRITNKFVAPLASKLQKSIAKQVGMSEKSTKPAIKNDAGKAIRKEPDAKLPKPAIEIDLEQEIKKEAIAELPEPESVPVKDSSTNDKIVNIRPPRPLGAKVISTRSNKPAGAKVISTRNTKSTQAESTAKQTIAQNEKIAKTNENITAQTQPEPTKTIEAPVTQKAQPSREHNSNAQTDKIKEKLGNSVKNVFSSIFSTETSSPSISAGLKDLANKREEEKLKDSTNKKEEESVNVVEGENHDQPIKRKRRRRR